MDLLGVGVCDAARDGLESAEVDDVDWECCGFGGVGWVDMWEVIVRVCGAGWGEDVVVLV